jgi:hypothetical protein
MSVTRFNPRAMFSSSSRFVHFRSTLSLQAPVGAASTPSGVPLVSHTNICSSNLASKIPALQCAKQGIEIAPF